MGGDIKKEEGEKEKGKILSKDIKGERFKDAV